MRIRMDKENKALILVLDNQLEALNLARDLVKGIAENPITNYPVGLLVPQHGFTLNQRQATDLINKVLHPEEL
jgi:hypothetical protein